MIIRSVDFGEPMGMDAPLSEGSGIYLVCTQSSGGVRIIGAYAAENIRDSFRRNEFRDSWKDHMDDGLMMYESVIDSGLDELTERCLDIIDTRFYPVPCVRMPTDDW